MIRSEVPPVPPYVEPIVIPGLYRVHCAEHAMAYDVETEDHAQNVLVKHLREQHLPALTEVNLTQAARWLLVLHDDPMLRNHGAYRGALGMWAELTGAETDEAALASASAYAQTDSPVAATIAPF